MLVYDLHTIGNNLYMIRKSKGFTQAEVAEKAELSDRTYADIERGNVTMRVDSLLKICSALHITPNDILTMDKDIEISEQEIVEQIKSCSSVERETILKFIQIYLDSLK